MSPSAPEDKRIVFLTRREQPTHALQPQGIRNPPSPPPAETNAQLLDRVSTGKSCSPHADGEQLVFPSHELGMQRYSSPQEGSTPIFPNNMGQYIQAVQAQRARTPTFATTKGANTTFRESRVGLEIVLDSGSGHGNRAPQQQGGGVRQYPSPAPCVITIAFPISSEQEIMISSRKWQELRHRHRHDARKQISPNGNRMENHTRSQPRARKPCSPITKCKTRILASARG